MADSTLESGLEAFFYKRVRLVGGRAIKLMPTEKGLPDRLVIFPGGRIHFVELKRDNGVVEPLQRVQHDRLRALGCSVSVVYGRDGVITWLRQVFRAAEPKSKPGRRPRAKVS